jgi:hypothetical protein
VSWSVTLYLLALLPIAAVIYIVRAHRKGSAARAAASTERFSRIFETEAAPAAGSASARHPAPAQTTISAAPVRAPGSYAKRMQVLSAHQTELRERLRRALPGHDVLSRVSLAAVIEVRGVPEGRELEQRTRALAQQSVDCVVCGPTGAVVAVVDLDDGSTAETRIKSECLKAAGVRYLRFSPLELPPENEVGAQVLGG